MDVGQRCGTSVDLSEHERLSCDVMRTPDLIMLVCYRVKTEGDYLISSQVQTVGLPTAAETAFFEMLINAYALTRPEFQKIWTAYQMQWPDNE